MKKIIGMLLGILTAGTGAGFGFAPVAQAAVGSWQQGVSIVSRSETDFAGDSFKQSVNNLAKTGANYVSLIIPYYQSNTGSTDIQRGWNTPSDEALNAAIRHIHSRGMKVMLKIHLDSYDGTWRAHINPGDRAAWYANYNGLLLHYAAIASREKAESFCIGTELVRMASANQNGDNTQAWRNLISGVRKVYSGQLTYSANWGAPGDHFADEKNNIDFWDSLDFIGISAYYTLYSDGTVEGMKSAWNNYSNSDIKPLSQKWNKPIVFTEVGYKSVNGAHIDPWDFYKNTGFSETDQANAYEALLSYWDTQSFMQGAHFWFWSSDPGYGGQGNTDYTPQQKRAESVIAKWFGGQDSTIPPPTIPVSVSCQEPADNAFSGCYYSGTDFNTPSFFRTDTSLNFDWGSNSPDPSVPADNFSARWEGSFDFAAGDYEFVTTADDGVKVYVDNQLLIDKWVDQAPATYRANMNLAGGSHLVKMEYYERGGGAVAKLSWNRAAGNPQAPLPGPANNNTSIWWPGNGVTVSGVQPFKALLDGISLNEYKMFWQVDNGQLNQMYDSWQDAPHKESWADVSGWAWNGNGPYRINFLAQSPGGNYLASRQADIFIAR